MKYLVILFLTVFAVPSFSQSYMDKIASETCECVESLSDTVDTEQYTMELGLCMITAAMPYKKQLKRDYKIDFDDIEVYGEQLGQAIGIKMASICPAALMKMAATVSEEEEMEEQEKVLQLEGLVMEITEENFVTFSIRDLKGKTSKFYWFTFVESDFDIVGKHQTLKGNTVKVFYIEKEYYDPRIKEYRIVNVITKINLI